MYFSGQRKRKKPLTDKWIVLDLDHTLINTFDSDHGEKVNKLKIHDNPAHFGLRERIYHLNLEDYDSECGKGDQCEIGGIVRPHTNDFLDFCFDYFEGVTVWSAGAPKYVERICDYLFQNIKEPDIILTSNHCIFEKDGTDTLTKKPLERIFKKMPEMKYENTFHLDDTHDTFKFTNKDNGILIPRYSPGFKIPSLKKDDRALLELIDWLNRKEVIKSKDVRTLDKDNIFTNK